MLWQLFVTGQFDFVMGKSTISQRWQVIGMKAAGATVSHIAQTMQMSQRTVYSILRRHRENPGDVKDRPRSGRRRATTGREDRALVRLAHQQRYATSSTLRNHWPSNVRVSTRTVRNRLRQHGHTSCRPARKPRLTARHRQVSTL